MVALGITKVFLKKEAMLLQLEKAREKFLLSSVLVIQRYWRREFARRKFVKLKEEAKKKAEEEVSKEVAQTHTDAREHTDSFSLRPALSRNLKHSLSPSISLSLYSL